MFTWSEFHPYVLAEVPMAPLPVVDLMLRKAAIEFMEETSLHVIDAPAVNVFANAATYKLDPGDTELDVCQVKHAWFASTPLPYVSQELLNQRLSYWVTETALVPTAFTQQDQDHVILYPIPTVDAPSALNMKLVVRPSLSSTGVYDWVGNRFVQEISYGALAMLCGMVGKPWSSPEGEKKYRAIFESAKTSATIDAYRSFTRASLRIALNRH